MQPWRKLFATKKKTEHRKSVFNGLWKVLVKSPQGLRVVTEPIQSQAVFWAYTKMATTGVVAQRFHWSPRGLEAVLFSSQIGFRLETTGFILKRVGTVCNLFATYLWLISDEAVMDRCFIGEVVDWLQIGL